MSDELTVSLANTTNDYDGGDRLDTDNFQSGRSKTNVKPFKELLFLRWYVLTLFYWYRLKALKLSS